MPIPNPVTGFDRDAGRRMEDDLVERLRNDPDTRVLVVRGESAPVTSSDAPAPVLVAPSAVDGPAEWAYAGRHSSGVDVLVAALDPRDDAPEWFDALGPGAFRNVGGVLAHEEVELFTVGMALARWLTDHRFCPACGAETRLTTGGWARACDACGREHFPRTDPAVIVAIESEDRERLLLGAGAAWGGRMYSCFAGFVEAGESAEHTIARELVEEANAEVHSIRYLGSQAWPFPRSLMLGYIATSADENAVVADGEEIIDVRWFTREEIGRGLVGEGEFGLPGPRSIAHRIIREWHEGVPAR